MPEMAETHMRDKEMLPHRVIAPQRISEYRIRAAYVKAAPIALLAIAVGGLG